jgi:ParB-like nuclease domain
MKDLKPRSLRIAIAGINVGTNPLRPLNGEEVKRLAVSMERIGLMTPITVRYHIDRPSSDGATDSYELIAGRHRLAAALSLGWDEIDAIEIECSDVDAKLWEIAENLHRAELTKLERDEQIALWIELTGEKVQSAGVRRIEPDDGQRPLSKMDLWAKGLPTEPNEVQVAPHKKRGQQPGGISAAARELGIEETDAKRAVKVASLSDEAKAAAREHGLDNNRSALLEAAREKDHEAQVDKIVARALTRRQRMQWLSAGPTKCRSSN